MRNIGRNIVAALVSLLFIGVCSAAISGEPDEAPDTWNGLSDTAHLAVVPPYIAANVRSGRGSRTRNRRERRIRNRTTRSRH